MADLNKERKSRADTCKTPCVGNSLQNRSELLQAVFPMFVFSCYLLQGCCKVVARFHPNNLATSLRKPTDIPQIAKVPYLLKTWEQQ